MKIKSIVMSAVGVAGLALLGSTAKATTTPHVLAFPVAGVWTYGASLTSGELHPGDGFTIFDFDAFFGFGLVDPDWTASAAPLGSPWGIVPAGFDDPGSMNLTFTYTPAVPTFEQSIVLADALGIFSAITTATSLGVDDWTSRDHLIGDPLVLGDGGVGSPHTDQILVPREARIPEGGSAIALLGFALLGLEALRRKLGIALA